MKRHQLLHDRVAVGPQVGGVHGIRVVVVRIGVLDLDHQHAREGRPGPLAVEVVRGLLLDAVVAVEAEALAVLTLHGRVRRGLAPVAEVAREVAVIDDERIACVGMSIESLREQDMRAQVHVAAPELREPLATQPHMFDVLRIRRIGDRRDDRVELDPDWTAAPAVPANLPRRAVEVARRELPLLALAAVHRQLDHVAGGEAERLVLVQQRLHRVLARRQVGQRFERVAEHAGVERALVSRLETFHVDAEDLSRREAGGGHLKPRLARVVLGNHQQQPSVDRVLRERLRQPDDHRSRHLLRRGQRRLDGRCRRRQDQRGKDTITNGAHGPAS